MRTGANIISVFGNKKPKKEVLGETVVGFPALRANVRALRPTAPPAPRHTSHRTQMTMSSWQSRPCPTTPSRLRTQPPPTRLRLPTRLATFLHLFCPQLCQLWVVFKGIVRVPPRCEPSLMRIRHDRPRPRLGFAHPRSSHRTLHTNAKS